MKKSKLFLYSLIFTLLMVAMSLGVNKIFYINILLKSADAINYARSYAFEETSVLFNTKTSPDAEIHKAKIAEITNHFGNDLVGYNYFFNRVEQKNPDMPSLMVLNDYLFSETYIPKIEGRMPKKTNNDTIEAITLNYHNLGDISNFIIKNPATGEDVTIKVKAVGFIPTMSYPFPVIESSFLPQNSFIVHDFSDIVGYEVVSPQNCFYLTFKSADALNKSRTELKTFGAESSIVKIDERINTARDYIKRELVNKIFQVLALFVTISMMIASILMFGSPFKESAYDHDIKPAFCIILIPMGLVAMVMYSITQVHSQYYGMGLGKMSVLVGATLILAVTALLLLLTLKIERKKHNDSDKQLSKDLQ